LSCFVLPELFQFWRFFYYLQRNEAPKMSHGVKQGYMTVSPRKHKRDMVHCSQGVV
jgi:hypothetical protein